MAIAAFSTVGLSEVQAWLGVNEAECKALVSRECQTNALWQVDDRRRLLVRRAAKGQTPTEVFERVVAGLRQANLQALMACAGKDAWTDLLAPADKDPRQGRYTAHR